MIEEKMDCIDLLTQRHSIVGAISRVEDTFGLTLVVEGKRPLVLLHELVLLIVNFGFGILFACKM